MITINHKLNISGTFFPKGRRVFPKALGFYLEVGINQIPTA
jgi:hypothetical protein